MSEMFARLVAAVAAHEPLHACPPAGLAPRDRCRAAAAEVRIAMANAARDRIPVETIAAATGFSAGYVHLVLERERVTVVP